jgi:hypothetical protein
VPFRRLVFAAAHARTTDLHTAVEAEVPPERVMGDFKAHASRCLNRRGPDTDPTGSDGRATGSTRCLWKPQHISAAIQYVVAEQREGMAVFQSDEA